jgi:hypothetical protein
MLMIFEPPAVPPFRKQAAYRPDAGRTRHLSPMTAERGIAHYRAMQNSEIAP